MKTSTYGLTHIAIAVKDLKRTKIFYQQVFGMEVMYDEKDFLQLRTPGTNDIIVFEKSNGKSNGKTGGIAHFGFRLRKPSAIKAITAKVKKHSPKIISHGEFVPGSPFIFFKDPDGYEIEVWYEKLPRKST